MASWPDIIEHFAALFKGASFGSGVKTIYDHIYSQPANEKQKSLRIFLVSAGLTVASTAGAHFLRKLNRKDERAQQFTGAGTVQLTIDMPRRIN